jgi:hypothetical protein
VSVLGAPLIGTFARAGLNTTLGES